MQGRGGRIWAVAAAFVALGGCGDGSGADVAAAGPVVRDSAGVTIVENPPSSEATPEWILAAEPAVEIGVLEGAPEDQLFRVVGALRLSDGRIAVANAGTNQVRIYDEAGDHLETWGGEGEGPGEFSGMTGMMHWAGDSLAVWDLRTRRITVFHETAGYGRSLPIPTTEGITLPRPEGRLDSGELVLGEVRFGGPDGMPESGQQRPPVQVMAISPDGGDVHDLGLHPGREVQMIVGEQSIQIATSPYSLNSVIVAAGSDVLASSNEHFELRFWDLDGGLVRLVRLAEPRHVVTPADREAALAARLEGVPEERRAGIRAAQERFPLPGTLPAMAGVVRDEAGHLWVEPYGIDGQSPTERWVVVGPDGSLAATVTLPAGLDVYDIGEDYLLASGTDDLGVERVRLWPLTRAP